MSIKKSASNWEGLCSLNYPAYLPVCASNLLGSSIRVFQAPLSITYVFGEARGSFWASV